MHPSFSILVYVYKDTNYPALEDAFEGHFEDHSPATLSLGEW